MAAIRRPRLIRLVPTLLLIALAVLLLPGIPGTAPGLEPDASAAPSLRFEPNEGQFDSRVTFLSRGSGFMLFLTRDECVLSGKGRSTLRMWLPGSQPDPRIEGREPLSTRCNYYLGNDPARWRTGVRACAEVVYRDVYPGIDLVYYGNEGRLEYDFVVAPGADPEIIRIAFRGLSPAEPMAIDGDGNLVLTTPGGEVVLEAPVLYQDIGGRRRDVRGAYLIRGEEVRFDVGAYDRGGLVIDPVIAYSTYLGGSDNDGARDVAVDGAGNAYMVGTTESTDFPGAGGALSGTSDVIVAKLSADGSAVVYATYLGGSGGIGGIDWGNGIAVDGKGNAYFTGTTQSTDFPMLNAAQPAFGGGYSDAFVAKLDTAGALAYSTYLGGDGNDPGMAIDVDAAGCAHTVGWTFSTNFPTTAKAFQTTLQGVSDAFVTKVGTDGTSFVFSTHLGGAIGDLGKGIAVDATGVYVAGTTYSPDFPTTAGAFDESRSGTTDVFVVKMTLGGGSLTYGTLLGGSGDEVVGHADGGGLAVDGAGQACVAGSTSSTDFPLANAAQGAYGGGIVDGFVTRLSATGHALVHSTYLGGDKAEEVTDISVDGSGTAHVTGNTGSDDFPTTADAPYPKFRGGPQDAFVAKLTSGGGLSFSTYLGGSGPVEGTRGRDGGTGVAAHPSGATYVVGDTNSTDFPTVGAFQKKRNGATDAFVVKFSGMGFSAAKVPDGEIGLAYKGALDIEGGAPPYTLTVTKGKLPDGLTLDNDGPFSGAPTKAGEYPFTVTAFDSLGDDTSARFKIRIYKAVYIKTTGLKDGRVGKAYDRTVKAKKGKKPYSWSVTAGALPPGLMLDPDTGAIQGTPTAFGQHGFTVRVVDDIGATDTADFVILIGRRDLSGTYRGTASITQTNSADPTHDGTFACTTKVKLQRRSGDTYKGSIKLTSENGMTVKWKYKLTALTFTSDAKFNGTFTFKRYVDGKKIATGTGTYNASIAGATITMSVAGTELSGDKGAFTGSVTATDD